MKSVLKFVLDVRMPTLRMPDGAKIVHVGHQPERMLEHQVALWAECDTDAEEIERAFVVVGTGNPLRSGVEHVGSALAGSFVWHVYEATAR